LEVPHFHKRQHVAFEFGLFEVYFPFLTLGLGGGFGRQLSFIHPEGKKVLLPANLRVELGVPLVSYVSRTGA
jgi:hypothetical protein